MPEKDTQAYQYQITINNPNKNGHSHEHIKETLTTKFKTLEFFCMADEQGDTFHTHIFVCFSSRVRFSTIKKHFKQAHIEMVRSDVKTNIDYIKKAGRWENDKKHGTSIEGTYEEYGTPPPDNRGKSKDMEDLYHMVLDGFTNAEIIAKNQDYILQIDKLDKLRTIILTEKYRGTRRLELEVCYIFGAPGAGKSRSVLDEYGDDKVFRVTDYNHPFDGYNCQPVLAFEEFRSSLPLKDMLNYLDIYPIELPARFSNKYACFTKIFLINNWELERQYSELQNTDTESWAAFLRRIHRVKHFKSKDTVIEYNSVSEYFNRDNSFTPISDLPEEQQLTIPFEREDKK